MSIESVQRPFTLKTMDFPEPTKSDPRLEVQQPARQPWASFEGIGAKSHVIQKEGTAHILPHPRPNPGAAVGQPNAGSIWNRIMDQLISRIVEFLFKNLLRMFTGQLNQEIKQNQQERTDAGIHQPKNQKEENIGGRQAVKMDGPQGFLFKPESDSDGKLAVLLPKNMTGDVESVVIKDANGKVLDKGRMTGVGNGDREHFRFKKSGDDFPPNVTVEVKMKDGSVERYQIADPSKRYD